MKKIILTLIFVAICLVALPQYYSNEQTVHFWGSEIGYYKHPGTDLAGPYKDLLDKLVYYKFSLFSLPVPLISKENKSGKDYRVLFVYTGLSFRWDNWYFDKDVRLSEGTDALVVNREEVLKSKSSKLTASYIVLPAMFEYQFNRNWYAATGLDFNIRLGSHTKYVYWDETGDRKKHKDREKFYLNGFQPDFVARFGWAFLSLNFRYSLRPLFQEEKGPGTSTYSLGLMIGGG